MKKYSVKIEAEIMAPDEESARETAEDLSDQTGWDVMSIEVDENKPAF